MQPYRFSIDWELDFEGRHLKTWTAPSALRCGDLILLYEAKSGGGRGAFVAIGRAVTDAMRAYGGDAGHWAWIEWRAAKTPVPLAEAQKAATFSVQASASRIDAKAFEAISKKLAATDTPATNALRRWKMGRGLPTTDRVPIRDLVLASLGPSYEWHSYDEIRHWLVGRGWRELPAPVRTSLRSLRGPLSFDPETEYGLRPDILLCRPKARRLLVVEVKRAAIPKQGYRNPVDQVSDYARACAKALRAGSRNGWRIDPMLVAEHFSPVVIEEAAAKRGSAAVGQVRCHVWDGKRLGPDLAR